MTESKTLTVNIQVPALEKLIDYTASGIGSVAGPMLATWRARREAEALRITAGGEADSMRIIAAAQADARSLLVAPDSTVSGELDLTQTVNQRIRFQEEKRQRNIAAVVGQAADQLGDKEVPDSETDHDWAARFFSDVQDVSSEEMQILWAKVLAGEMERAGSTSIRALNILRNLDQNTARLFGRLCSACVMLIVGDRQFLDARAPSLGGNAANNALQKYGFTFDTLNVLNEYGLIISDYDSWYDYRLCLWSLAQGPGQTTILRIPFKFQGKCWVFDSNAQRDINQELRLSGIALSRTGRELSNVVNLEPLEEYTTDLMNFVQSQNLQMTEVESCEPQVFDISNQMRQTS